MNMARRTRLLVAAAGVLALGTMAFAQSPWSPERLSPAARRVVQERMQDHGREMGHLVWDVLLLDYAQAAQAATAIAKGASPLDRNAPELEHHVYFFTLQDQLRARSLVLADAARAQDGIAVSSAFNQVSETCVHCHVVYLEPSPLRRRRPQPSPP